MSKDTIDIREIRAEDNTALEAIIRACFHEFKIPLEGTAYEDPETKHMFESYQDTKSVYFILEYNGEVAGGAGIQPLKDSDLTICELQKMYFSPRVRGKGLGKKMIKTCLEAAKVLGYSTCYLESASQLKAARHIYESLGFNYLDGPLGSTGHFSCGVWMRKEL